MLYDDGNVAFRVEIGLGGGSSSSLYNVAQYDVGTYGGTEPSWVDVSDRVLNVSTRRGRQRFGDRVRTGRAVVTLDNFDGRWNPNFGAPTPGDLELRLGRWVRLVAYAKPTQESGTFPILPAPFATRSQTVNTFGSESGIGSAFASPIPDVDGQPTTYVGSNGAAVFDIRPDAQYPTLSGGALLAYLRELNRTMDSMAWDGTRYRQFSATDIRQQLNALDGGTLTVDFIDPAQSITWTGSATGRPWEINGKDNTVTVPPQQSEFVLWQGFINDIDERYMRGGDDSVTVLTCLDFQSRLANIDNPALETPRPAELTGARFNYLLDVAGWPTQWRRIDTGLRQLQSSTIAQNLLVEAQLVGQSEGVAIWQEGRDFVFRQWNWQETERSANVQMWISGPNATDPDMLNADQVWTMTGMLRNDVSLGARNSTIQRVQDTVSQGLYGQRTYRKTDYENADDADVLEIANAMLNAFAFDYSRLQMVQAHTTNADAARSLFSTELLDLVRATVPLTLRDWGYTVDSWVFGVEVAVTPDDWSMSLRLDDSIRGAPEDLDAFADGFSDGFL